MKSTRKPIKFAFNFNFFKLTSDFEKLLWEFWSLTNIEGEKRSFREIRKCQITRAEKWIRGSYPHYVVTLTLRRTNLPAAIIGNAPTGCPEAEFPRELHKLSRNDKAICSAFWWKHAKKHNFLGIFVVRNLNKIWFLEEKCQVQTHNFQYVLPWNQKNRLVFAYCTFSIEVFWLEFACFKFSWDFLGNNYHVDLINLEIGSSAWAWEWQNRLTCGLWYRLSRRTVSNVGRGKKGKEIGIFEILGLV